MRLNVGYEIPTDLKATLRDREVRWQRLLSWLACPDGAPFDPTASRPSLLSTEGLWDVLAGSGRPGGNVDRADLSARQAGRVE